MTLCGGGAKSPGWSQMFADILGSKIVTIKGNELGAKGVILNNAVVQGYYKDYKEAVDATVEIKKVYEPDMKKHEEYMKFYPLYKKTYEQLKETWKLRSSLVGEE